MRYFNRLKFHTKLNLVIFSIIVLMGVATAVLVSRVATQSWLEESRQRGESMARNLAARAVDPMLAMDLLRLKNLATGVAQLSDYINYAFIQDRQGDVLVHTFKGGFPVELKDVNAVAQGPDGPKVSVRLLDTGSRLVYDYAAPVSIGGDTLGTVRLGVSRAQVELALNRVLYTIFAITGAVALLASLLGSFFARNVARRINILRESAEEVVRGNLDIQTAPPLRRNCWEVMDCDLTQCPAWGDERRRCWYQAGTLCPSCRDTELPRKLESCRDCKVYQANAADEIQSLAETFDVMALALKTHIGELKNAQQDILRQQQLMQTILDVTPDMVSLQDKDLVYRAVNKAFCAFFAMDESDVVGRTDFDIFPEAAADMAFHEDRQILMSGMHMSKQSLMGKGDARRWFHILKVPVRDEQGRIIGLLLTARDITVIKQYQERLIQSQKMEDLGRLAGGVAHEINTPLGIILGYAQLLLEDAPGDSQLAKDLAIIEKQSKVCRRIVSDLLGFSRHIDSARRQMDLNESVSEVVSVVEHIFKQERVAVLTELDPGVPPIEGDKEKLKQVWLNLLNNAFDAMGHDGAILVRTKLCSHRKRVVVSVADTGSGITREDLGRIFDPFFTTKPVGKGTGLGLSISFGIVGDHGGKISAMSPAPMEYMQAMAATGGDGHRGSGDSPGTVFFVELPLTEEGLPEEECPEIAALKQDMEEEGGGIWQK